MFMRIREIIVENFEGWFGSSIVKDARGLPIPMYHGSSSDIKEFSGFVNWFSMSPKFASEYADLRDLQSGGGANVTKAYIRAERPFDADVFGSKAVTIPEFVMEMVGQAQDRGVVINIEEVKKLLDKLRASAREEESGPHYSIHNFWFETPMLFGSVGSDVIKKLFMVLGYDSIKYTEDGEYTIGVFSSNQIKSAIGNRGSYGDSGDITKESGLL